MGQRLGGGLDALRRRTGRIGAGGDAVDADFDLRGRTRRDPRNENPGK
jgi:hypothetical protein